MFLFGSDICGGMVKLVGAKGFISMMGDAMLEEWSTSKCLIEKYFSYDKCGN